MVEAMGGKCSICSYARCLSALEFHHIDPTKKDFGFGSTRANPASWEKIADELRKCVLLCGNCHRELHDGMVEVPVDAPVFDERYADYKAMQKEAKMVECPICSKPMYPHTRTCSLSCAARKKEAHTWDGVDLPEMLKTMRKSEAARVLGLSPTAITKRLKKIKRLNEEGRAGR